MALSLADFNTYKSYFLALSGSHVDITDFVFADEMEMNSIIRSAKLGKVMWLDPYDQVQLLDSISDNFIEQYPGALTVASAKPGKFADQDILYQECESIVKDVIAKLLMDYQADPQVLVTQLSSYKFAPAEATFGATTLYGCRLEFTFTAPAGLTYNPAKWT